MGLSNQQAMLLALLSYLGSAKRGIDMALFVLSICVFLSNTP